MRVIVTGASSFIGAASVRRLEELGHEVTAFRHSFDEEPDRLPGHADVWLHFAWAGRGSEGRKDPVIQEQNVGMTLRAAEKAAMLGCGRFVFAGSQAEYGHAQDGSLKREDGECRPVSEYGRAKLRVLEMLSGRGPAPAGTDSGEGTFFEKGVSYIHMRLFSVYGPGDHEGSLVNTLIRGFGAGDTVSLGACTQAWNYLYIDDAAAAIALLCEAGEAGVYNIGGSDTRPLRWFVGEIRRMMGGRGAAAYGTRKDNAEGAADLSPDLDRIQSLGFRQEISFEEGIRRTAGALQSAAGALPRECRDS